MKIFNVCSKTGTKSVLSTAQNTERRGQRSMLFIAWRSIHVISAGIKTDLFVGLTVAY